MTAADERVAELLQRWLTSLELHERYLSLDDAAYARVQDWPRHQRPTRWVVDVARTRLTELQRQVAERRSRGDAEFTEALELMGFLTSLLGSEHIERFIPLARSKSSPADSAKPATPKPPPTPRPTPAAPRSRSAPSAPRRLPPAAETPAAVPDKLAATVVADAVRFLRWGREWPQLAGLIARLADRPPEAEIWKILRRHRADIEAQARRPTD